MACVSHRVSLNTQISVVMFRQFQTVSLRRHRLVNSVICWSISTRKTTMRTVQNNFCRCQLLIPLCRRWNRIREISFYPVVGN